MTAPFVTTAFGPLLACEADWELAVDWAADCDEETAFALELLVPPLPPAPPLPPVPPAPLVLLAVTPLLAMAVLSALVLVLLEELAPPLPVALELVSASQMHCANAVPSILQVWAPFRPLVQAHDDCSPGVQVFVTVLEPHASPMATTNARVNPSAK